MMALNRYDVRVQAEAIYKTHGKNKVPVDVEDIAKSFDLTVIEHPTDKNLSGMLAVKNNHGLVFVNSSHHPRRRRFSLAHELGHFILHTPDMTTAKDKLVIYHRHSFNDPNKDLKKQKREREANQFAAALLMPSDKVIKVARDLELDLLDDNAIDIIAQRFDVSNQAMSIRLQQLDLLTFDTHW